MTYRPRKIKHYKKGDKSLSARDLNDIVARIQRLENMSVVNPVTIRKTDAGIVLGLHPQSASSQTTYAWGRNINPITSRSSGVVESYNPNTQQLDSTTLYVFNNPHNWLIPAMLICFAVNWQNEWWIEAVD